MYLKSLEVTGFKSFPEKMELHFSGGITAVVGPNGCGKSNLVDAIRWALGEQSVKVLRGARMEELIFSGTGRRKPLNYAEVSLVLDHADEYLPVDYRELAVTRRMYRSGEGEYYINKNACKLREIKELFLDTGIGTETYSLIGQGKIEQLVGSRPEEHRELFEEAAGILKYKQRKKTAVSRLEEMNRNLMRIEDLLAELKDQQALLSMDAERARQYEQLSRQLKKVNEQILLLQWWQNEQKLERTRKRLKKAGELLEEKKNNLDGLAGNISEAGRLHDRYLDELHGVEKELRQKKDNREKHQSRLDLIGEQKKHRAEKSLIKSESLKELQERVAGLEDTRAKNNEELENIRQEQVKLGNQAERITAELSTLQEENDISTLQQMKKQVADKDLQMAALEQSLKDNRERLREAAARIEELEALQKKQLSAMESSKEMEKELASALQRKQMEMKDREEKILRLQQRVDDKDNELQSAEKELRFLEKELEGKKTRLKYLLESEEALSYFSGGVKAIMKACSDDHSLAEGVYGPVANIIEVDPGYARALDIALGPSVQYVITEDETYAQRAIELLKEKKAGRATFLPLNVIKPFPRKGAVPGGEEGFLGTASSLVNVPGRFKNIINYLLGNVLVAKDLDTALRFMRMNRAGWKIVTLEGEMITGGGAISGGYRREEHGFLSRKKEIKNLQSEIADNEVLLHQKKSRLEQLRVSRKELTEERDRLESEKKILEKEIFAQKNREEKVLLEKNSITGEIDNLQKEITAAQQKYASLQKAEQEKKEQYARLQESTSALNNEISALSRKVQQKKELFDQKQKELVEIRIKFSGQQEKESSLQEIVSRQDQEKKHLQELSSSILNQLDLLKEELEQLDEEEKELTLLFESEKKEEERLAAVAGNISEKLKSCSDKKKHCELQLGEGQKERQRLETRCHNLNIELVKLEEARKYILEQLRHGYGLERAPDPPEALESEENLQLEKERLEKEISLLGDVNVAVIKEYDRLQKRIAFLEEQKGDLLEGEKGIKKVLKELDGHMEKKFLQTLKIIENNFNEVFVKLFGGGQGLLRLTDPEDVLESGIEIVAQPPGKKMQNVSLLSGGEKALTAIALLFAFLKYKPVPFCVLDEIDSSLDDSNLENFVCLLKKFSEKTQFILITHRRRTMEEADMLYGITMEEQGISKAVSLSLAQKVG